jgi:hypothetical protein
MKKTKGAVLALLAGSMLLGGGCLGLGWKQILWGTALYVGQEFVLDNANVFNLFPDTTPGA